MFDLDPDQLHELLHDPVFSSEETVAMTGADNFSFRNWLKRGTPQIGRKHRLGRWAFSPADLMRVSAMVDLVEGIGLPPMAAARLAEEPVKFVEAFIRDTKQNRASADYDGHSVLAAPMDRYVTIALVDQDETRITHAYWDGDRLRFTLDDDAELSEQKYSLLGVTHVVLGTGLIVDDIMTKVHEAMQEASV